MYRDFPLKLFRHFRFYSEAVSMKKRFILCGWKRLLIVLEGFLGKEMYLWRRKICRSSSEEICVISMVLDGKGQWVGLSVVFIPKQMGAVS